MFPSKPYCFALVCPALLLPSLLLLLLLLWSGLPCFALLISLSDSRSLFALCCFVLLRFAFASLCLLFCLFGCSWPLFGPSWPVLGRSWALLGRSWPLLGRSWAALGRSWGGPGATHTHAHTYRHAQACTQGTTCKNQPKIDTKNE